VRVIFFISILGIFLGCNESRTPDPSELGYDFYPISIGQYRIYDVEEINFQLVDFDTSVFQLRETIFDSIVSIDQVTYLIRRDVRADASAEWRSDSVWTVSMNSTYLALTENGIPYIKLSFPVSAENQWDGNGLNNRTQMIYRYETIGSSLVDSIPAEDHIRVIIEDRVDGIVGNDLRSEVYAKGIGLVEKDYFVEQICNSQSSCGNDFGEVIGGRSLKQVLVEVGNE